MKSIVVNKWVAAGCVVAFVFFAFVLHNYSRSLVKGSDAYMCAVEYLQNNAYIRSKYGAGYTYELYEKDGFNITQNAMNGTARFSLRIHRNSRDGRVRFKVEKLHGSWGVVKATLFDDETTALHD